MNWNNFTKEDLSRSLKCAIVAKNIQKAKEIVIAIKNKSNYLDKYIGDEIIRRQVEEFEDKYKEK